MLMISGNACGSFEHWVEEKMRWQAERYRYLGMFTTKPAFQTFDSPKNMSQTARNEGTDMRTFQLVTDIVDNANFVKVIRIDSHLFAMDQQERHTRASARENNWTEQLWE